MEKLCTCLLSGVLVVNEVGVERGGGGRGGGGVRGVGSLLLHHCSSSHSCGRLNLSLSRFLSGDGDFFKQEFS